MAASVPLGLGLGLSVGVPRRRRRAGARAPGPGTRGLGGWRREGEGRRPAGRWGRGALLGGVSGASAAGVWAGAPPRPPVAGPRGPWRVDPSRRPHPPQRATLALAGATGSRRGSSEANPPCSLAGTSPITCLAPLRRWWTGPGGCGLGTHRVRGASSHAPSAGLPPAVVRLGRRGSLLALWLCWSLSHRTNLLTSTPPLSGLGESPGARTYGVWACRRHGRSVGLRGVAAIATPRAVGGKRVRQGQIRCCPFQTLGSRHRGARRSRLVGFFEGHQVCGTKQR